MSVEKIRRVKSDLGTKYQEQIKVLNKTVYSMSNERRKNYE